MDFLIYFIPGIIAYGVYSFLTKTKPPIKDVYKLIQVYATLTLFSFILLMFFSPIILGTSVTISNFLGKIENANMFKLLLLLIAVFIVPGVLYLVSHWIMTIKNNTEPGATVYYKHIPLKTSIARNKEDKKAQYREVNSKSDFNNNDLSIQTRPIIFYKDNKEVLRGILLVDYELPWEYIEIMVDTMENSKIMFTDDYRLYTYYDNGNNIKIEIYKHYEEYKEEKDE